MATLLLVEDDKTIRTSLAEYLTKQNFRVLEAGDLAVARSLVAQADLIVLDWNLPDGEGPDLVREWRQKQMMKPVIFLTAHTELTDRVIGLEIGAQDYVVKPFEPRELLARIRVHLRVQPDAKPAALEAHGVSLNSTTREAHFKGRSVDLAKMEFDLLKFFMEHPGEVFSREDILNRVWGFENFPTTRTVDTHVLILRQKFTDTLIETVRGVGYRMKK